MAAQVALRRNQQLDEERGVVVGCGGVAGRGGGLRDEAQDATAGDKKLSAGGWRETHSPETHSAAAPTTHNPKPWSAFHPPPSSLSSIPPTGPTPIPEIPDIDHPLSETANYNPLVQRAYPSLALKLNFVNIPPWLQIRYLSFLHREMAVVAEALVAKADASSLRHHDVNSQLNSRSFSFARRCVRHCRLGALSVRRAHCIVGRLLRQTEPFWCLRLNRHRFCEVFRRATEWYDWYSIVARGFAFSKHYNDTFRSFLALWWLLILWFQKFKKTMFFGFKVILAVKKISDFHFEPLVRN